MGEESAEDGSQLHLAEGGETKLDPVDENRLVTLTHIQPMKVTLRVQRAHLKKKRLEVIREILPRGGVRPPD